MPGLEQLPKQDHNYLVDHLITNYNIGLSSTSANISCSLGHDSVMSSVLWSFKSNIAVVAVQVDKVNLKILGVAFVLLFKVSDLRYIASSFVGPVYVLSKFLDLWHKDWLQMNLF